MQNSREVQLFRPVVSEEAIASVVQTLRSGWIGLGPKTNEFEHKLAEFLGSNYCVSLISGTAALHLALKLADVTRGDEVITTPITFVSTSMICLYEGVRPVFADVEPDTLNINPDDIKRKITDRTRAIIVVHYRGHPVDLDAINKIADEHDLMVIEDLAHACGSEYKGRKVGNGENICVGSLHAVKPVTTGEGGFVSTNNSEYHKKLNQLRWLGIDKDTYSRTIEDGRKWYSWRYMVNQVGYKCHGNDILSSIGIEHLKDEQKNWEFRQRLVDLYQSELAGTPGLEFLATRDYCTRNANHLCVIKVGGRNKLLKKLKSHGVNCGVHYYPNHLFPVFSGFSHELPVAEEVWRKIISLPLHLLLTDDDVRYVCGLIRGGW